MLPELYNRICLKLANISYHELTRQEKLQIPEVLSFRNKCQTR